MEMREQILASAQRLVQTRGFNGFSYADIAKEVGIRKASVHHHFPTKTDLGVVLVEMYAAMLDAALLNISASSASVDEKLASYVGIYRNTLEANRVCLGGMLASEALTLDQAILPGLKNFFARNTQWLTEILTEGKKKRIFFLSSTAANHAHLFVSSLQGALMLARATGDRKAFDQTVSLLLKSLLRKG
ncbi:TetR/AcrR family transcriptional regulator [Escherichia coli]|nr:TetR/AcrR family transcriptional regulator [Salmonella enterica]